MMDQRLRGHVALVTGAARGIGAAIAHRLAADQASVIVNYSTSAKPAEETVAAINSAGGKAIAIQADVRDPAAVTRMFDSAAKAFGPVTILVNNAGVADMRPLEGFDAAHFEKLFNTNVKAMLLCSQAAARQFGERGGVIVNISSNATRLSLPGAAVYTATKAAVDAITRVLAAELGPRGIRVNAVCPGFTETDLNKDYDALVKEQILKQTPLGRFGKPEDIADVVAFLCSDDAHWVTKEIVGATGGLG